MSDADLQRTAYEACVRRVHMVGKRYMADPFAGYFARDETILNSPLMNRGTYLRITEVETALRAFAARAKGEPIQVISFGAGFDTLYFRLKAQAAEEGGVRLAAFVELDMAPVIAEKERIVQREPALRALASPGELHLRACDLRQLPAVVETLRDCVQPHLPTFLLAEMVFGYMEAATSTGLLRSVLQDVLHIASPGETSPVLVDFVLYDVLHPNDRFGQTMQKNFAAMGLPLKGLTDFPSLEAHVERCKAVGFTCVQAVTMRQLYNRKHLDVSAALNALEMIDDWDEWSLIHDHYLFLVASTASTPTQTFAPAR